MVLHDFECKSCQQFFEEITEVVPGETPTAPCPDCGTPAGRVFLRSPSLRGVENDRASTVYYENSEGKIGIPGRANEDTLDSQAMHRWYRQQGFQRRVATTDAQIAKVESRLNNSDPHRKSTIHHNPVSGS